MSDPYLQYVHQKPNGQWTHEDETNCWVEDEWGTEQEALAACVSYVQWLNSPGNEEEKA